MTAGKMNLAALSLLAVLAVGCVKHPNTVCDVYEKVLPALREVGITDETVPSAALGKITVTRGKIGGVPENVADQAYVLDIRPNGVSVTAGGEAGERYARITLQQMAKLAGGKPVPSAKVKDYPKLVWRGVMNDCGRNFLALEGVKAFIDVAAAYKMNLFHWHLTDYHGWRLESKKYPQLQDRKTFVRQIGKYYTQKEFREIVAYAAERGITIMPELDVPGHTLAFRKAFGIETMKAPGTDKIISDLIDELCALAPKDVMPFIHLGTDEVRVDPERVPDDWCSKWADTVTKNGRATVVWAPGETVKTSGQVVDMVWHDNHITNSSNAAIDSARMYFASTGPFFILPQASFVKPCRWAGIDEKRKLGAIACAWHDDAVGDDTMRLFRNATIFPAILAFADNYWHGREKDYNEYLRMMPPVGTDAFKTAQALEKRLIVHRDVFFKGTDKPFAFLKQSDMRWRLTWENGKEIASDVPQATIDLRKYVKERKGTVIAETWVKSPCDREVGAWISFTDTGSAYVRTGEAPLPGIGQWNRHGAKLEINGVSVPPPHWSRPGAKITSKTDPDKKSYKGIVYSNDLCETPISDEWYFLRPPRKVSLRKGWNHVKLTLPRLGGGRWTSTFAFLGGTSDHPCEIEGLEYSASKPQAE